MKNERLSPEHTKYTFFNDNHSDSASSFMGRPIEEWKVKSLIGYALTKVQQETHNNDDLFIVDAFHQGTLDFNDLAFYLQNRHIKGIDLICDSEEIAFDYFTDQKPLP